MKHNASSSGLVQRCNWLARSEGRSSLRGLVVIVLLPSPGLGVAMLVCPNARTPGVVLMRPVLHGTQLGARRLGHLAVVLADVEVGPRGHLHEAAATERAGFLRLVDAVADRVEGDEAILLRYRLVRVVAPRRHVLVELAALPVQCSFLALQQNIKY